MPRNVVNDDIYKMAVYMHTATQVAVNSFNIQTEYAVGGGMSPVDMCNGIANDLAIVYKPCLGNNARWDGVTARLIDPLLAPPPVTTFSTLHSGPGTGGADMFAEQASGLISWGTDFRGPHFRGRSYIPFPTGTLNDDPGKPTAIYVGLLGAIATQVKTGHTVIVGVNRLTVTYGCFLAGFVAFTPYKTSVQHGVWATQIRRSDYRRKNTSPF